MLPVARSGNSAAFHATMNSVGTYASAVAPVQSVATRTGAVTLTHTDITDWAATLAPYAPLASPAFTGTPSLPTGAIGVTQTAGTSNTSLATTAFVGTALGNYAPLAAPVFTGDARAVTPAYGDNDTSVATTAFVQSAVAPAFNDVGRNRLHNPGFTVNQRSYTSGTALAAAAYGHDRWKGGASGRTYTFTQSYPTTTITITAGSLQQVVEAIGVAAGNYVLSWTGTAQGRVNAGSYAASPVTAAGLPANTAITVEFNTGTVGSVQLEIGTQATPLDAGGSPQQILAECQRFFFQAVSIINYGYGGASGNVGQYLFFPVAMRATPTIALSGQSYVNASGLTAGNITSAGCLLYAVATATGNYYWVGNMTASADL